MAEPHPDLLRVVWRAFVAEKRREPQFAVAVWADLLNWYAPVRPHPFLYFACFLAVTADVIRLIWDVPMKLSLIAGSHKHSNCRIASTGELVSRTWHVLELLAAKWEVARFVQWGKVKGSLTEWQITTPQHIAAKFATSSKTKQWSLRRLLYATVRHEEGITQLDTKFMDDLLKVTRLRMTAEEVQEYSDYNIDNWGDSETEIPNYDPVDLSQVPQEVVEQARREQEEYDRKEEVEPTQTLEEIQAAQAAHASQATAVEEAASEAVSEVSDSAESSGTSGTEVAEEEEDEEFVPQEEETESEALLLATSSVSSGDMQPTGPPQSAGVATQSLHESVEALLASDPAAVAAMMQQYQSRGTSPAVSPSPLAPGSGTIPLQQPEITPAEPLPRRQISGGKRDKPVSPPGGSRSSRQKAAAADAQRFEALRTGTAPGTAAQPLVLEEPLFPGGTFTPATLQPPVQETARQRYMQQGMPLPQAQEQTMRRTASQVAAAAAQQRMAPPAARALPQEAQSQAQAEQQGAPMEAYMQTAEPFQPFPGSTPATPAVGRVPVQASAPLAGAPPSAGTTSPSGAATRGQDLQAILLRENRRLKDDVSSAMRRVRELERIVYRATNMQGIEHERARLYVRGLEKLWLDTCDLHEVVAVEPAAVQGVRSIANTIAVEYNRMRANMGEDGEIWNDRIRVNARLAQ
jgi:hypothetical protein